LLVGGGLRIERREEGAAEVTLQLTLGGGQIGVGDLRRLGGIGAAGGCGRVTCGQAAHRRTRVVVDVRDRRGADVAGRARVYGPDGDRLRRVADVDVGLHHE